MGGIRKTGVVSGVVRVVAVVAVVAAVAGLVVLAAPASKAAPTTFVTMSDGVPIAVGVQLPNGYVPGRRYPTIFEISGYDGASAQGGTLAKDHGIPAAPQGDSRQLTQRFEGEYVTVHASVRGTGCSGGQFDLFSWRSAEDGKEIVDRWIPRQPWSNGDVAIVGHSYSGITGYLVAATQPAHLRAMSVSGLIDDLYRGIVYPGGVPNYGFPLLWAGAVRPVYDVSGGVAPGLVREPAPGDDDDRQAACATAQATKSRTVTDDPLVQGLATTDTEWYRSRSLVTYADRVRVPLHVTGAYQDEQTGPRGPTHVWQASVHAPVRRLLLTNGDHDAQNPGATGPEVWGDRKAFVDHFLLRRGPAYPATSVRTLWELHEDAEGTLVSNGRTDTRTWPLETTRWVPWYLQPDGGLAPSRPGTAADFAYVSGSPRQAWSYQGGPTTGSPLTTADGPDQIVFRSAPLRSALAIAGPITATLDVTTTAPDTDLFVQLADEAPDGSRTYLQRGMLKASHRAYDPARSDKTAAGLIYRPWRPHTNPTFVTPGQPTSYLVEVFPIGHVFRPGHRLVVLVHTPPAVDSYYAYFPERAPAGVNTLHVGPAHLSRLVLPVVPTPRLGPALACGRQDAVRCIPAA
jgi:putative CocE/NonD family hydrolase